MSAWTDAQGGVLLTTHRYGDGASWGYVATGLVEGGSTTPVSSTPELIGEIFATFGDDLRSIARNEQVPIEFLVAAIALVAERVGTVISAHYIEYLDGYIGDDETPTLVFVGCTGLRLDYARAIMGPVMARDYVADPNTAIAAAARHMLLNIRDTNFQPPMIASSYNADGLRYDATTRWRMANQPQIDRFLGWFNAAVFAVVMNNTLAAGAPSFAATLATITPPSPPAPSGQVISQQFYRPESQAAMDAGMMTLCEHNPMLSAIWALDMITTNQIGSVAKDAAAGMGLPMSQPYFAYPDRNGTMRLMNAEEVQQLYRAMRDYIAGIMMYDTGRQENLPGQPVYIP